METHITTLTAQERQELLASIFKCTRCGYCCQGKTTVSLDWEDQRRMIDTLGLTEDEVRELYWRVTGNIVQMKVVDGHCIFYQEKGGCSVHRGRPWRCAQWPLHPSILLDAANFSAIRSSCPGINPDVSYTEFCTVLRRLLEDPGHLAF